jgi:hypothetical protein
MLRKWRQKEIPFSLGYGRNWVVLSFLLLLCCCWLGVVRGAPKIISKDYALMPDGKGGFKTVASFTISCQRPYESVQFTSGNHSLDVFCGSVRHKEQIGFTGYYIPEYTRTYSSKVCENYNPVLPLGSNKTSGDADDGGEIDDGDEVDGDSGGGGGAAGGSASLRLLSKRDESTRMLMHRRQKRFACSDLVLPQVSWILRTQCQDSQSAQMVANEMNLIKQNQGILDNVHALDAQNQEDVKRLLDTANQNNMEIQTKFNTLANQVASSMKNLENDVNSRFQSMDSTFMSNQIQLLQQLNMYTDDTRRQFQNITNKFEEQLAIISDNVKGKLRDAVNGIYHMLNGTVTTLDGIAKRQNLTHAALSTYNYLMLRFFRSQLSYQDAWVEYDSLKEFAKKENYTLVLKETTSNGSIYELDAKEYHWDEYQTNLSKIIAEQYQDDYMCSNDLSQFDIQTNGNASLCQRKDCNAPDSMYVYNASCSYQFKLDEIHRDCNVTDDETATVDTNTYNYLVTMGLMYLPIQFYKKAPQPICFIEVSKPDQLAYSALNLFAKQSYYGLKPFQATPPEWFVMNVRSDIPIELTLIDAELSAEKDQSEPLTLDNLGQRSSNGSSSSPLVNGRLTDASVTTVAQYILQSVGYRQANQTLLAEVVKSVKTVQDAMTSPINATSFLTILDTVTKQMRQRAASDSTLWQRNLTQTQWFVNMMMAAYGDSPMDRPIDRSLITSGYSLCDASALAALGASPSFQGVSDFFRQNYLSPLLRNTGSPINPSSISLGGAADSIRLDYTKLSSAEQISLSEYFQNQHLDYSIFLTRAEEDSVMLRTLTRRDLLSGVISRVISMTDVRNLMKTNISADMVPSLIPRVLLNTSDPEQLSRAPIDEVDPLNSQLTSWSVDTPQQLYFFCSHLAEDDRIDFEVRRDPNLKCTGMPAVQGEQTLMIAAMQTKSELGFATDDEMLFNRTSTFFTVNLTDDVDHTSLDGGNRTRNITRGLETFGNLTMSLMNPMDHVLRLGLNSTATAMKDKIQWVVVHMLKGNATADNGYLWTEMEVSPDLSTVSPKRVIGNLRCYSDPADDPDPGRNPLEYLYASSPQPAGEFSCYNLQVQEDQRSASLNARLSILNPSLQMLSWMKPFALKTSISTLVECHLTPNSRFMQPVCRSIPSQKQLANFFVGDGQYCNVYIHAPDRIYQIQNVDTLRQYLAMQVVNASSVDPDLYCKRTLNYEERCQPSFMPQTNPYVLYLEALRDLDPVPVSLKVELLCNDKLCFPYVESAPAGHKCYERRDMRLFSRWYEGVNDTEALGRYLGTKNLSTAEIADNLIEGVCDLSSFLGTLFDADDPMLGCVNFRAFRHDYAFCDDANLQEGDPDLEGKFGPFVLYLFQTIMSNQKARISHVMLWQGTQLSLWGNTFDEGVKRSTSPPSFIDGVAELKCDYTSFAGFKGDLLPVYEFRPSRAECTGYVVFDGARSDPKSCFYTDRFESMLPKNRDQFINHTRFQPPFERINVKGPALSRFNRIGYARTTDPTNLNISQQIADFYDPTGFALSPSIYDTTKGEKCFGLCALKNYFNFHWGEEMLDLDSHDAEMTITVEFDLPQDGTDVHFLLEDSSKCPTLATPFTCASSVCTARLENPYATSIFFNVELKDACRNATHEYTIHPGSSMELTYMLCAGNYSISINSDETVCNLHSGTILVANVDDSYENNTVRRVKDFVSYVEGIQGIVDHRIYELAKKASNLQERFEKYGFVDFNNSIPRFVDNMQNVSFRIQQNVKATFDAMAFINSVNETLQLRMTEYNTKNDELLRRSANISQDIWKQYAELQQFYDQHSISKMFGNGTGPFGAINTLFNIIGSGISTFGQVAIFALGILVVVIVACQCRK